MLNISLNSVPRSMLGDVVHDLLEVITHETNRGPIIELSRDGSSTSGNFSINFFCPNDEEERVKTLASRYGLRIGSD